MNENLWQLGTGGLLVYLVVREMFHYLKTKKNGNGTNGHSGEKPVSYWQMEFRRAIHDETHDRFADVERKQQEILVALYELQRRTPRR